jgi:hypothetical protein
MIHIHTVPYCTVRYRTYAFIPYTVPYSIILFMISRDAEMEDEVLKIEDMKMKMNDEGEKIRKYRITESLSSLISHY